MVNVQALHQSQQRPCSIHWENYISLSFHIEWDMIVVTVFLSISNQMEFHLVWNRKENCQHGHIPFNMKGNGNSFISVEAFVRWINLLWNCSNAMLRTFFYKLMLREKKNEKIEKKSTETSNKNSVERKK